ncbi:MAG: restriction endonuclease subunit S [Actinobacteria bacterium]|nr:restriction endonuclease subunit S [Actinomycetota bacterium]
MDSRWQSVAIGEVAEVAGGSTPSTKVAEYWDGVVPWLTPRDLSGDHPRYVERGERNISEHGLRNSSARLVPAGTVLLSTRAPVGYVAIARRAVSTNQGFRSLIPGPRVDSEYLYYWLSANTAELERHATGTTFRELSGSALKNIRVTLPVIDEQKSIAGILAALDDKIELNRRMAETLDGIAQTLFRKWFVEPAGRAWPSGGEGLPEGWKVERLGEHVDAVRGLSYSGAGLTDDGGGLPMHNLNSVYEGGGYKRDGLKRYTGDYKERHTLRTGDLVVTNTEQGFGFLLIGYPALVPRCFGETGLFSHHLYRVRPRPRSPLTTAYLYWLLRDARMHRVLAGFTNGTTVNMLPLDGLEAPKVVVPPASLVEEFTKAVAPMQELRECLESENDTLREIRDTLLPPLLDGRIEVPTSTDGEAS